MTNQIKILNAVKLTGGMVFAIGIILFSLGFIGSGYTTLIPLGIGAIVGAVILFIMGIFFVATEELLERNASRG
jgi:hypothetical protein